MFRRQKTEKYVSLFKILKNEAVLIVSFILAAISVLFVPVDQLYLSYIDYRTLAILFCLMVIMAGLQRLHVFRQIGESLILHVGSTRGLTIVLMLLCFFFSMFITNDVALLTFVPFTIIVLHMAGKDDRMIFVIVIETLAANLGSMMLPMGNPQNLYLYSLTGISIAEFVRIMLPYGLTSLVILLVLCMFKEEKAPIFPATHGNYYRTEQEKRRILIYLFLFGLSILVVTRILDFRIVFPFVFLTVLLTDRKTLVCADYSLIFTFIFLFIFIGNMKRIPSISIILSEIVTGREVLTAIVASQVISNVPAAILLSGFTDNIRGLIIGTNLGGLGTLIASMASLISFKQYSHVENADMKTYFKIFTFYNVMLLLALSCAAVIFR